MPKCDFNNKRSPVNLLHIFRTPFPENTSEGLLLSYLQRQPLKVFDEKISSPISSQIPENT